MRSEKYLVTSYQLPVTNFFNFRVSPKIPVLSRTVFKSKFKQLLAGKTDQAPTFKEYVIVRHHDSAPEGTSKQAVHE